MIWVVYIENMIRIHAASSLAPKDPKVTVGVAHHVEKISPAGQDFRIGKGIRWGVRGEVVVIDPADPRLKLRSMTTACVVSHPLCPAPFRPD